MQDRLLDNVLYQQHRKERQQQVVVLLNKTKTQIITHLDTESMESVILGAGLHAGRSASVELDTAETLQQQTTAIYVHTDSSAT